MIATLPQHGQGISSFVRHDSASGRVVVRWFEGPFGGRMGADFVELATGKVTAWDVDAEVADAMRFGEPDPRIVARWQREVLGAAPGPSLRLEHPHAEAQVVQRDADGAHPAVRDTQSFDSGDVARSSGGLIAWPTYVRAFRFHALAIASIDQPTAAPTYRRDVPDAGYLAWSADGATLYATTSESVGDAVVPTGALLPAQRTCFVKIDPVANEVTPLRCTATPEEMSVAYDTQRTRAAIITRRRDEKAVDIELVALPTGERLATVANVDIIGDIMGTRAALDASGRLVSPGPFGGKAWYLDDKRFYIEVTGAAQLDAHRWLAVGTNSQYGADKRSPELVMIDLAAVTRSEPRRLTPLPVGTLDPELPARTAADRFWERASPCAAGQQLVSRAAIAGTEHACVDRRGTRVGAYAIVDGDTWHVLGAYRNGKRHGTWIYYSHGTPTIEMRLVAGQE